MSVIPNCKECVDLLLDYLEGNLDSDLHNKLDQHFSACPPCVSFLKSYRACSELAEQLRDQEAGIPAEVVRRLQTFLKEEIDKV